MSDGSTTRPQMTLPHTQAAANILVFCAGNRKARNNFQTSIATPIPTELVLSCFPPERHAPLRDTMQNAGGFFAWALGEDRRAATFWARLVPGDVVLGFFEFHYRTVSQLAAKAENETLAEKVWGNPKWRRILLLTKPVHVTVPAKDVCPPLCSTYRGTARISDARVAQILSDHGSIPAFIQRKFGVALCRSTTTATPDEGEREK